MPVLRTLENMGLRGPITLADWLVIPETSAGPAMALISSQALGADAASITFSSIPQTYAHLELVVMGRGTAAFTAVSIRLRINSDTAANYDWQGLYGNVTTAVAGESLGDTGVLFAVFPGTSVTSGIAGASSVTIFDYARTAWQKGLTVQLVRKDGTTSGNVQVQSRAGFWRNTNAVTSLTVLPNSDNLASGTIASLYGIKG